MRKNKIVFILLAFILLTSSLSLASNVPNQAYDFYVYDELGIISKETEAYIIDINEKLYGEVGSQVVIAVLENTRGEEISQYAVKLFRKWEIGSREKDNGVLVLASMEDRKVWIATGYGIEGAIPDTLAYRIIENYILPNFKNGDYEDGLLDGFNEIANIIAKEYGLEIEDLDRPSGGEEVSLRYLLIVLIGVFFIDGIFFKGRLLSFILRMIILFGDNNRRGPPGGMGGGSFRSSGPSSGGFSGGGGRTGGGGAGGSW